MVFIVVGESSENQFGRPKKRSRKFSKIFRKSAPPPLEKILDLPLEKLFLEKLLLEKSTLEKLLLKVDF